MRSHEKDYSDREGLLRFLLFLFPSIAYDYISDAIEDAYIASLKAPEHVLANPKIKYRWIRRVAYRRALAERKRLLPFVRLEKIQYEIPYESAESGIENALTIESLMNELSPVLKETIQLHYIEGYSIKQISTILAIKQETVKKRCNRAKVELKRIYAKEN